MFCQALSANLLTCYLKIVMILSKDKRERCQSGRMCTLGKRVYRKVPGVRIPLSPDIRGRSLLA